MSTDPDLLDPIRLILQSGSSLVSCDRRRTVHSTSPAPAGWRTRVAGGAEEALSRRNGIEESTERVCKNDGREVENLVDAADLLLGEQPPSDALRTWVERLAGYVVTKHGLGDALRKTTTPRNDLSSPNTYNAIVGALDRLLTANVAAGNPRTDLNGDDVILALAGLWQLDPASDWQGQARRIYDIVLSGLRRPTRKPR